MKKAHLKSIAYNFTKVPNIHDMAHLILTLEAEINSLIYKGDCLAKRVEVMSNETYKESSVLTWNSQVEHMRGFLRANLEE